MFKFSDEKGQLKCSFCGKNQEQVRKLVAGPGVYICDECIELCNEIIEEEIGDDYELNLVDLPKPAEITKCSINMLSVRKMPKGLRGSLQSLQAGERRTESGRY